MVKKNKNDSISNEELAIIVSNGFSDVQKQLVVLENRVGGVEVGVAKSSQKIDGLSSRIDDVLGTHVKLEMYKELVKCVAGLEDKFAERKK